MKRTQARRRGDTRSASRTSDKATRQSARGTSGASQTHLAHEHCENCSKDLSGAKRALFVEEEVGRMFCSEACISGYFTPEIKRLEKEYLKRLSPRDLNGGEREKFAHLRWKTLKEPDEVWREKTLRGDHRFTLISEFQNGSKRVWCVCICLFLRGEPSFLYLAFPSRSTEMVNYYRRGERVEWNKPEFKAMLGSLGLDGISQGEEFGEEATDGLTEELPQEFQDEHLGDPGSAPTVDGLADSWTEDESVRAELNQHRSKNDIPKDEFILYHSCIEETIEQPDEVWKVEYKEGTALFHFIRYYPNETPAIWYIVVAREMEGGEQLEILDALPTKDLNFAEGYRRGTLEVGASPDQASSSGRFIH